MPAGRMADAVARDAERVERALRGEAIYGDDFAPAEVEAWIVDEREAYFQLGVADDRAGYRYAYRALNEWHGFRHLPAGRFGSVLGYGSAYGEELLPIIDRVDQVTIVEPGRGFARADLRGVPLRYVEPPADGRLPFADGTFDLVVCFSVLHHVPTVSRALAEMWRTLRPGGYALLREPVISMGDWRRPRRGLTRRERGIPRDLFLGAVRAAGLEIVQQSPCVFSLTSRLRWLRSGPVFDSPAITRLDAWICRLPIWGRRYHADHPWEKLRAMALAVVARKP